LEWREPNLKNIVNTQTPNRAIEQPQHQDWQMVSDARLEQIPRTEAVSHGLAHRKEQQTPEGTLHPDFYSNRYMHTTFNSVPIPLTY
jgi:hypothetical protein